MPRRFLNELMKNVSLQTAYVWDFLIKIANENVAVAAFVIKAETASNANKKNEIELSRSICLY